MATIGVKLRVFVPKEVMNLARVNQAIQHVMIQKTTRELKREFEKTVSTWDHKPNWTMEHYFGVRVLWVKVFTYSTQYRIVNAGAAPHLILPRRAKILRFQTKYKAKTRARLIGSFAGGKSGPYISTPAVYHPGFEARDFDITIAEEYAETFHDDIQEAIKDGIIHA
ncbi:MAG: hypothetical protein EHM33_27290 [Chloroflexi bacterium]|nr:MAG: hypothetical protein EHM33_27290 [Chloroflexota bacterium]